MKKLRKIYEHINTHIEKINRHIHRDTLDIAITLIINVNIYSNKS